MVPLAHIRFLTLPSPSAWTPYAKWGSFCTNCKHFYRLLHVIIWLLPIYLPTQIAQRPLGERNVIHWSTEASFFVVHFCKVHIVLPQVLSSDPAIHINMFVRWPVDCLTKVLNTVFALSKIAMIYLTTKVVPRNRYELSITIYRKRKLATHRAAAHCLLHALRPLHI